MSDHTLLPLTCLTYTFSASLSTDNRLDNQNNKSTNGARNTVEELRIWLPAANGNAIEANQSTFEWIEITSCLRINIPNVANSYCQLTNERLSQMLSGGGRTLFDAYAHTWLLGMSERLQTAFNEIQKSFEPCLRIMRCLFLLLKILTILVSYNYQC